jgi:hypothetical protein
MLAEFVIDVRRAVLNECGNFADLSLFEKIYENRTSVRAPFSSYVIEIGEQTADAPRDFGRAEAVFWAHGERRSPPTERGQRSKMSWTVRPRAPS